MPTFPHKYLFKEVSPRTAAKKKRAGLCKFWGCRRPAADGYRACNTCRSRLKRAGSPKRYAYDQLRDSARKRGITFELTFKEFLEFDRQVNYVESKGKKPDSLTVDRIDGSKGYRADNIRAMSYEDNCSHKLEGFTQPADPIAQALCEVAGDEDWRKWLTRAGDVLDLVERLQAVEDNGYEPECDVPF